VASSQQDYCLFGYDIMFALPSSLFHRFNSYINKSQVIHQSLFYLILRQNGELVVNDTTVELTERNQSLKIILVKPENEGKYSCVVKNRLYKDSAEGSVTITGEGEKIHFVTNNSAVHKQLIQKSKWKNSYA
jgi:hypothetical protein